jgi:hypothetical protein
LSLAAAVQILVAVVRAVLELEQVFPWRAVLQSL